MIMRRDTRKMMRRSSTNRRWHAGNRRINRYRRRQERAVKHALRAERQEEQP